MNVSKYAEVFLKSGLISNNFGSLMNPVSVRMTVVRNEMQFDFNSLIYLD